MSIKSVVSKYLQKIFHREFQKKYTVLIIRYVIIIMVNSSEPLEKNLAILQLVAAFSIVILRRCMKMDKKGFVDVVGTIFNWLLAKSIVHSILTVYSCKHEMKFLVIIKIKFKLKFKRFTLYRIRNWAMRKPYVCKLLYAERCTKPVLSWTRYNILNTGKI